MNMIPATTPATTPALQVEPIAALSDNYIWLLHDRQRAWVVDPGDAAPVQQSLQAKSLRLEGILITHHHPDHIGGVAALHSATGCQIVAPAREPMPFPSTRTVDDGDVLRLFERSVQVMAVPGHTLGHVAYFFDASDGEAPWLFCGDTLFSAGCGRLFEGTPAQMLASLDRLAALPDATRICCAHEYTLANLRFARAVEPDNPALQAHEQHCTALRARGLPTLPSTLALERRINPFLRSREPQARARLLAQEPGASNDADFFGALRRWKDHFR
jgi:hydroxyacylglutathione hydrolase